MSDSARRGFSCDKGHTISDGCNFASVKRIQTETDMETTEETIYDLEAPETTSTESADSSETETTEVTETSETDKEETETTAAAPDGPVEEPAEEEKTEQRDAAREEIDRMMEEMGAARLLEIIKGERNAAIDQIIKEIGSMPHEYLPSGDSVTKRPKTIFDLASLA